MHILFADDYPTKPINDQLGQEAGDRALVIVAQRLRQCLGDQNFVGKLGGDEFVVLLPGIDDAELALSTARQVIAAIAAPMALLPPEQQRLRIETIGDVTRFTPMVGIVKSRRDASAPKSWLVGSVSSIAVSSAAAMACNPFIPN